MLHARWLLLHGQGYFKRAVSAASTMGAQQCFNLIDAPWIPVLWSNGTAERVGIKRALTQAHEIRQLASCNPMDNVGLLRFLLAVLYWCKGNPPDGNTGIARDPFPSEWFDKLEQYRHCFNLLGDGRRFYQVHGSGRHKSLSANYLMHEIPTGTNAWHFRHSTDRFEGLCPACCAMGLVRLPVFATSGGRGKPPGINRKPPLYVFHVGPSLAATLRLSWRKVENLGQAAWEDPEVRLPQAGDVSILTGLTWLPRRVWLDDPAEPEAPCIACGTKTRLIRCCVFEGIGSKRSNTTSNWRDPHVLYEYRGQIPTALYADDALAAPDKASRQWAKILAELLPNVDSCAIAACVVAFATVQNDKYLEAKEWYIRIPHRRLDENCRDVLKQWFKHNPRLPGQLRPSNNKTPLEIKAALSAMRQQVDSAVCARVSQLLCGGAKAWKDARAQYEPMLRSIASSVAPGVTTAALQRRRTLVRAAASDLRLSRGVRNSESKLGSRPMTATLQYIQRLQDLKPGVLGLLRLHAAQRLDTSVDGFDLFTGLWWPLRQANQGAPRREVAWMIAKLYAYHPIAHSPGHTLAHQLGACCRHNPSRERFQRRFDELLVMPLAGMERPLQWALDAIASARDLNLNKLDWVKLTDDLSIWHREEVRLEWARQFLESAKQ